MGFGVAKTAWGGLAQMRELLDRCDFRVALEGVGLLSGKAPTESNQLLRGNACALGRLRVEGATLPPKKQS